MRTALVLLFLLAVAAVPGALLPQRSINQGKVDEYLAANGKLAEFYDKIQLFDVFSSSWFTAIYVLLFISLIGCIIPRTWEHAKALRTPPVRAPKNLGRMGLSGEGDVDRDEDAVAADVRRLLRRWRITEYAPEEDRAGKRSFAAERGYLREVFNLVFHLGLVGILVTVAAGRLMYYEGQVIVVTGGENTQFCNTAVANFDSFKAGPMVDGTNLKPFCVDVHNFSADYLPNGQADMFRSDISYAEGPSIFDDPSGWAKYQLRVNHPLRLDGASVYLQGHGYAPKFTVKWPNGEVRTQSIQFRPDDLLNFLSSGAMRFDPPAGMHPDLKDRRQHQLAIQGLFAPTAAWSGEKGQLLSSQFPAQRDPAVAIDIYRGDAGLDTGRGQSIFSLESGLIHSGQLQKLDRVNLGAGQSVTLDDGTQLTFDGATEFANLQITHNPTELGVLVSALTTLIALVGSLLIKRRRIWVRLTPLEDGTTHVETAGLARTDRAGWGREYHDFHRELLGLPPVEWDADSESDSEIYGEAATTPGRRLDR